MGRCLMTSANSLGEIAAFKDERWAEENLGKCKESKKKSKLTYVN